MMSDEFRAELTVKYGEHDFDYPLLSDYNIMSVIKNHKPNTFEELDHWCKKLNETVAEIKEMQRNMK